MRRTDLCHLILSYQHPRFAGSRLRPCTCVPGALGEMPDSTSVQSALAFHTMRSRDTATGIVFPPWRVWFRL